MYVYLLNYSQVLSRLSIYKQNADAVSSSYSNITNKVTEDYFLIYIMPILWTSRTFSYFSYLSYTQIDGSRHKGEVFKDIESLLTQLQQNKVKIVNSGGMNFQKHTISNFGPDIFVRNWKFISNCYLFRKTNSWFEKGTSIFNPGSR